MVVEERKGERTASILVESRPRSCPQASFCSLGTFFSARRPAKSRSNVPIVNSKEGYNTGRQSSSDTTTTITAAGAATAAATAAAAATGAAGTEAAVAAAAAAVLVVLVPLPVYLFSAIPISPAQSVQQVQDRRGRNSGNRP